MKKANAGLLAVALSLVVAITGCGQSNNASSSTNTPQASAKPSAAPASAAPATTAAPAKEPVVLKLGHGTATTSLYHLGSVKFKDLVEAKTNGQVKVQISSDGTIGQDADLINFMKTANVQMGMVGVEPLTTLSAKLKATNLPYIFPDRATAFKVLDGPLGAEMVAEMPSKHGIRILAYFENGFRNVTNSKKEILTPADLKGLKIRTPQSPVSLGIFKALGANPTPMSFGELYNALEQKTVDGQENPLALIYANKFYEVQKFVSITNHIYSPMVLAISEKTWAGLSPDLQKALQDAANEARDYERKLSADQEADYIKNLEAAKVKISKPDLAPFIAATKDVHKEFDADYGADFYQKLIDATKK